MLQTYNKTSNETKDKQNILGDRFSPNPAIHSFFNQVKAFRLYF